MKRPTYEEFLTMSKNDLLSHLDVAYREIDRLQPINRVYNRISIDLSNRTGNNGFIIDRSYVSEEKIVSEMENFYIKGAHFTTLLDYINKNETLKDEWETFMATLAMIQLSDNELN
ncbi:hypothetical protein FDI40_gp248 [Agrobacterium phage Atu_ph07]|uniref:Uncharacterized protein n=1 Tax=Agrobacterium phage Atu_ph07 TaxID=2024264 RepID=A0A2L0UZS3_9CAUD|nr:hypothetical protein FDI40_gp248 [Agrobacterium phage Atu_ph07]AUZ95029.1 hypothetical protein [Agrobacterium phage Atu_ph07]